MSNQMLALKIYGKLDMKLEITDIPIPKSNQVRIKISYVGICGSDLHYYFEGANGSFIVKEPLIPGHELSGVIDLDPSGKYKAGTKVTVHPSRPGNIQEGIENQPHLWPQGSYLGSAATNPHTQGAMSEYLVVEDYMVREIPEDLDLEIAALAEPLGVAIHAINICESIPGKEIKNKKVLISGSGPIGLLVAAACKIYGAKEITCSDVVDGALQRALEVGANKIINVSKENIPQENFDLVFECAGVARAVSAALESVKRNGVVIQVGMLAAGEQNIRLSSLVSKEVKYLGVFRFNNEIDEAIKMLKNNPGLKKVITQVFPISEAVAAFEIAKNSEISGKVLVKL